MSVAQAMTGAFLSSLFVLAVVISANLDLKAAAKNARTLAERRESEANAAKAETARYARANDSMRQHTAEHCAREAALLGLLAANGIRIEEVSTDDLTHATTPADIDWGAGS